MASRRFLLLTLILAALLVTPLLAEVSWPGNFHKSWVCGRVTASGKPVPGVRVMAFGDAGMAMTHSAANGNYSLGVGAGKWTVTATHKGFRQLAPAEVTLRAEEANESTDLMLVPSTCMIQGRVVDEQARPLPHSAVMAAPFVDLESEEDPDDSQMQMPVQGVADDQGRFSLTLDKGTWLVSASRPDYEMSPKNPPIRIPGMPEGMAMTLPGLVVRASESEPGPQCVVVLRPAARQEPGRPATGGASEQKILPQALVLAGRACLSPGNVLHWTRRQERDSLAGCLVKRSTTPFDGRAPVVDLNLGENPMGVLQDGKDSVFSLTDTTASPGATYYYAVQEIGSAGAGPLSNPVRLTTR